jgi:hypothetical protein
MTQELIIIQELVKKEASKLKEYATQEELEQLDFNTLRPYVSYNCIYGQMTGSCYSDRANELILKCAERVYIRTPHTTFSDGVLAYQTLNGGPHPITDNRGRCEFYHSPIEVYVILNKENSTTVNNKMLIDYLQGVTTELDFVETKEAV